MASLLSGFRVRVRRIHGQFGLPCTLVFTFVFQSWRPPYCFCYRLWATMYPR